MLQCRRALAGFSALPFLAGQLAGALRKQSLEESSCSRLRNHGSFCSVEIGFGTPAQRFQVVADTGSDMLLVEDCVCEEGGYGCDQDRRCYRGHKSSSFHLSDPIQEVTITYGSGPIKGVYAAEETRMGDIKADMDPLILITENRLEGHLQVQGILGLGPPQPASGGQGFFDKASVPRFSMCLNEDGETGSLRTGSGVSMETPISSIGQEHWAVDVRGIKVRGSDGRNSVVPVCGPADKCAGIPDSGTTLIMAPKAHIDALYAKVCDAWPRCRESTSLLDLGGQEGAERLIQKKARALLAVASDCDLDSMPALHFDIGGAKAGESDTLELLPTEYMFETNQLPDESEKELGSEPQTVCRPAFSPSDLGDTESGQVWILGTPFFYKYNVAYNRDPSPPAISFNKGECSSCGGAGGGSLVAHQGKKRRSLHSAPRVAYINTTKPL